MLEGALGLLLSPLFIAVSVVMFVKSGDDWIAMLLPSLCLLGLGLYELIVGSRITLNALMSKPSNTSEKPSRRI